MGGVGDGDDSVTKKVKPRGEEDVDKECMQGKKQTHTCTETESDG